MRAGTYLIGLVTIEIFRLELFSVLHNISKRDEALRAFARLGQNNHAFLEIFLGNFQKRQSIENDWDEVRVDKNVRGTRIAHLVG